VIAFLAVAAFAGEHDAPAPGALTVTGRTVPDGPPRDVSVAPGDDVDGLIASLPAGSRVRLLSGHHHGPLVVDRSLELFGEEGAVVDGGGRGSVITVVAADVALHDLRVTGGGFLPQQDDSGVVIAADRFTVERVVVDHAYIGIDVREANDGSVRGCTVTGDATSVFGLRGDGIRLWEAERVRVEGNVLTNVRDLVVWYSSGIVLRDNTVRDSRYGTHLMHADHVDVAANRYDNDIVGVFAMYASDVSITDNVVVGSGSEAGVGLGFKESDRIEVIGNDLVGNTTGVYLDTTPQRVGGYARFHENLIGANQTGVRLHGVSGGAEFVGNAFVSNATPASTDSRNGNERVSFEGNAWNDYAGYDLDGDGFGDVPYEARTVSGALVARRPELAWFNDTPAAALIELFARAFPMFAPRPIVVDARPSMENA
jgi:nitrous oxidase accessory protein